MTKLQLKFLKPILACVNSEKTKMRLKEIKKNA